MHPTVLAMCGPLENFSNINDCVQCAFRELLVFSMVSEGFSGSKDQRYTEIILQDSKCNF
jgi:hypothetical protein